MMKKSSLKILITGFIMSTLILFSCNKENILPKPLPTEEKPLIELNEAQKKVVVSDALFGFDLYNKIIAFEEKDKNIMISPLSIKMALGMTYNGADGATKEAMEKTLGFYGLSTDEINQSYKDLITILSQVDPKVIFEMGNSIWYRNTLQVLASFIQTNQYYFDAEIHSMDFNDPASKDIINNWVAEKTHEKITSIIEDIDPNHVMFLINAIYFKGAWTYEFDPQSTQAADFIKEDGNVITCDMMFLGSAFHYTKNQLFEAIDLPYGNKQFSMTIFLPQSPYTVDDIAQNFTLTNWNNWLASFTMKEEVFLTMPKFKYAYKRDLSEDLQRMGMGIAFSSMADFSKISPDKKLQISEVKHKSYIEVNEEGTEAAAVTSVGIINTSVGDQIFFNINRPFLYVIHEKDSRSILFMGRVKDPTLEE
jgi:serine protease inhibitor